jgi:hypothetical protein
VSSTHQDTLEHSEENYRYSVLNIIISLIRSLRGLLCEAKLGSAQSHDRVECTGCACECESSRDVQYTMQDLWYNHVVSTNDWRREQASIRLRCAQQTESPPSSTS